MSGPAPLPRPTAWRLMLVLFAIWAADFAAGYALALVFPGQRWVRFAIVGLTVLALAAVWRVAAAGQTARPDGLVGPAALLAAIGIAFQGLVGVL